MTPQRRQRRERHFRVTYVFGGAFHWKRLSVDEQAAISDLEVALRRAAAKHETLLACLFHEVELVDYEEICLRPL